MKAASSIVHGTEAGYREESKPLSRARVLADYRAVRASPHQIPWHSPRPPSQLQTPYTMLRYLGELSSNMLMNKHDPCETQRAAKLFALLVHRPHPLPLHNLFMTASLTSRARKKTYHWRPGKSPRRRFQRNISRLQRDQAFTFQSFPPGPRCNSSAY